MLLFDLTSLQGVKETKSHGGGKYAQVVFMELLNKGVEMKVMYDSLRSMPLEIQEIIRQEKIKSFDLQQNTWENVIKKENITRVYSALPDDALLKVDVCPIYVTLHGLRALEMYSDITTFQYKLSLSECAKIFLAQILFPGVHRKRSLNLYKPYFVNPHIKYVTVSNHTKYAILSFYDGIKADDIEVFYSHDVLPKERKIRNSQVAPYFFMVSANRPEKNCLRVIRCLDKLFDRNLLPAGYKVKITGVTNPEDVYRYKIHNKEQFTFLGYVSEQELSQLYADATVFIYPSITEGFGYPPLEAMNYGVPVVASAFTSIPEICGDAALYFNPLSEDEITNRLLQVLSPTIYTTLKEKGKKRYQEVHHRQEEDFVKLCDFITNGL